MLKVVHISDLHFNAANAGRIASLLESVRAVHADHLIISGDLAASAHAEEFQGLGSLLDQYGLADGSKLTIVPGNHDMFGFIYQTFTDPDMVIGQVRDLRTLASSARVLWRFRRKLLTYNDEAYRRDMALFRSYFPHAVDHIVTDGQAHGFPFARLLGSDVVLIGVDSNYYLPKVVNLLRLARGVRGAIRSGDVGLVGDNLSGSTGRLDTESLRALLEHPEVKLRRKILVMHHFLYPEEMLTNTMLREMRLVNRAQVVQLVREYRIDLVLHGHWHITNEYRAGGARVVNAGGARWSGMNIIHIGAGRMRVTVGATLGRVRT